MDNKMYITNPADAENNPHINYFFHRIRNIINYLYTLNLRGNNLSNISLNSTFEELEKVYGGAMEKEQSEENERIANTEYQENKNYTIVGPLDFKTAKRYGDLSAWQHRGKIKDGEICYTQKIETWNKYTWGDKHTVYVILKDGWENIPPNNEGMEPYNEYGLSMIFVIINDKGELVWCNTRLNHFADYAQYGKHVDHALTKEEISKLIGRKFDEVFIPKPSDNEETEEFIRYSAECDRRIANGEPLGQIFEYFDRYMLKYNKCCVVESEDYGCNIYIPNKGILVKNQWFDDIEDFFHGLAKVKLNGFANVIDMNGNYRSDQWFDNLDLDEGFIEYGLILVYNDGKHNILNIKTKNLISNIWFDDTAYVEEGEKEYEYGILLKCLTSQREIFYVDKNGRLLNSLSESKEDNNLEKQNKNMKKNIVRLTESELKRVITESVIQVIQEAEVHPGIYSRSHEREWDTYTKSYKDEDTVNDMVPDFVYTLTQRLENYIKRALFKSIPNLDEELCNIIVKTNLDTSVNYYNSLKTNSTSTERKINFVVLYNLYSQDGYLDLRKDIRLGNKVKSLVIKYASMVLGNIEGCNIKIGDNGTDYIVIIAQFNDYETWHDSGHNGFEKTRNDKSSLFKNNPPRQIQGRRNVDL
jgi:hypothetical protein